MRIFNAHAQNKRTCATMEDEDDSDFDEQSLLQWKKQKVNIQKRHGKGRLFGNKIRKTGEERKTSCTKEKYADEPVNGMASASCALETSPDTHSVRSTSPIVVSDTGSSDTCLLTQCAPSTSISPLSHHQTPTLSPSPKKLKGHKKKISSPSSSANSKGQTSLHQFATVVHRSTSDSLRAHRSNISQSPPARSARISTITAASSSAGNRDIQTRKSHGMACGESTDSAVVTDLGRRTVQKWGPKQASKKQCPFYKRVPETELVVDAFSYGSIPNCPAYFLSHFHSDHYMGLSRHFQHPIYCTQVTANLVEQILKVSPSLLHPLPLNEPCCVEGVQVTLIDANHCPGSAMFLFTTPSGKNYLHTGDFRYCVAIANHHSLKSLVIHQLFLDTTYCKPQYSFPTQEEVIEFAVRKSREAICKLPDTVIISGTYTIGKEKVFLALAEALDSKICVTKEKERILGCLQWPALQSLLTTAPLTARVHVLPMKKLNVNDLSVYLESLQPVFSRLLAFLPTGWSHNNTRASLSTLRPRTAGSVSVYSIPYSEHSSFTELRQFVQSLTPQRVVPTVGNQSTPKRNEMMNYLEQWRKGPTSTLPHARQMKIDSIL